jgi:hydrogenase expression/formation protein HypC
MCIALPMCVVVSEGDFAIVEGRGETRRVSLLLVGPQATGTPLLIHTDTALRVLDEAEAALIDGALAGLQAVLAGESPDGYFRDLIDRTPQLPAHLRGGLS